MSTQPPTGIVWQNPITITKGGTYTGNWQSNSVNTPAVTINTTQPVIILNSNIQSKGDLIQSTTPHANITVKGTSGWALNPNVVQGQSPGRFLDVTNFDNVRCREQFDGRNSRHGTWVLHRQRLNKPDCNGAL